MAEPKTIDQLPKLTKLSDDHMIPVDDGAQSYAITWANMLKQTGGIKSVTSSDTKITLTLNDGTSLEITTSDPNKQDKLTFDTTPTSNSTNPVTSGGVYVALTSRDESIAANQKAISANASALSTLNGDKTTAGSVAYQVAQAIAAVVANAPEDFDTLKEISDWISSHSKSASAMNSQILANTKAITAETERAEKAEKATNDALASLGLEVVDGVLCAVYDI